MDLVICNNGKATTTSLKVAEYFGKQHSHVIRAIETLLQDPAVAGRSNFGLSSYINEQNKQQPMYEMDRDGFTLLAMGFTGRKALTFKLSYIDAFNRAEQMIQKVAYFPVASSAIEAADVFQKFNEVGKAIGLDLNLSAISANHAATKITNVNVLQLMNVKLIAPVQSADYNPSQLDSQFNPPKSAIQVNEMLVQLGYQKRTGVKQCPYEATPKGKSFCRLHDQPRLHTVGASQQLR